MRLEMKAIADGLIEVVRGYVDQVGKALADRLEAVEQRLEALPSPKDGIDGKDGQPGKDAEPVDTDAVVAAVLAKVPAPKDGQDGKNGADGKDGEPGKDGASFTAEEAKSLLEPELAKWALDFERRAQDTLQKTIDRFPKPKDGQDGKDGVDAIGFDDLTVEHDGARGFTLKFVSGERVKEFAFSVPVVIDAGYYREGDAYEKGDGVTFGGSYWIAQSPTYTKPEIGNSDWRLAVKKGRDAKTPTNLGDPK